MLRKLILGFGVVLLLTASALAAPVGCWLYFNIPDYFDDNIDIARADIKQLEHLVLEYQERKHFYPLSLWELIERDPIDMPVRPIGVDVKFTDPWGQGYCYDPNQLHPKTGMPLIYSEGRPGRKKRITNWD
ncbi:MAG TPA: hypothetical protein VE988_07120 [Gemmataceae bacterium]|nr:hypothetical protein [Gemmataceae bacterium]